MRPLLRFLPRRGAVPGPALRTQMTPLFRSSPFLRTRLQSSSATSSPAASQNLLMRAWTSPVGIKTVHFWAPVMKWALVLTGVSDFYRPAEKLSLTQNVALMATGAIWTRWCFIIRPKNMLLAAVNFFLGCVGAVQVSRIVMYQQSLKTSGVSDGLQAAGKEVTEEVQALVKDPKSAVEKAVK